MDRAALLARGRAFAEAGMVDTCRIRRRTGTITDRTTGQTTPTYLDPDPYAGKCRVQQSPLGGAGVDRVVGEAYLVVVDRILQLPVAASAGVRADDEVTITAVAPSSDPGLLNRRFTVKSEYGKTDMVMRRLGINEVTS